MGRLFMVEHLI